MTPQVKSWAVTQADTPPGSQELLCPPLSHNDTLRILRKDREGLALKDAAAGHAGKPPTTGQAVPSSQVPGGHNTCHHDGADARLPQSLDNWGRLWLQQVPHDQQPQEAQLLLYSVPRGLASPGQRAGRRISAPLPGSRWGTCLRTPGMGSPGQLLSGLKAGCDGQRLTSQGHDSVASGCVGLQHLGKVAGYCRDRECHQGMGGGGVRGWDPPRLHAHTQQWTLGLPPSPVSGLQRLATSSGEPLT